MMYTPRFLQDPGESFFLFGPRGTGKTTWLRERCPDALWIDLLDPGTHREFAARPERLRALVRADPGKRVVVVDEVQKVPELLDVVHGLIEEGKRKGPRFILTGSSARKLRRGGVDLLAGRALLRTLHPFMAGEVGSGFDLDDALLHGLVPLVRDSRDRADSLRSYAALYVREEVHAEGLVRSLGSFARFLEAVSHSHASVLSLAEISRECQVSRATAAGYLSVIEDLLLAFRVPVFTRRAKRILASHPKFYWFDPGLFRAFRRAGPLDRSEELAGPALEGLVAQHLRAWIDYSGAEASLSFWRTKSGNEVDFVLYGKDIFWAIEIKNSTTIHPGDVRSLAAFREDYPESRACLLYRGQNRIEERGILCLPCAEFLAGLAPGKFPT